MRTLSEPTSRRVTSYRTVAINGSPLAYYAHDRGCAARAEAITRKLSPCWTGRTLLSTSMGRSGLLHPGDSGAKIRHRCHLIVTYTRTSKRKNRGARPAANPPALTQAQPNHFPPANRNRWPVTPDLDHRVREPVLQRGEQHVTQPITDMHTVRSPVLQKASWASRVGAGQVTVLTR